MAHFAELDGTNKVIRVIVVHNNELTDENGRESEQKGIAFCKSLFGQDTRWVQTSYNASFRKNYAGVDYEYDSQRDAFIAPQPYPSWILNGTSFQWEPPVPYPADGNPYVWNEDTTSWQAAQ